MRAIFVGAVAFSRRCLQILVELPVDIALVVTLDGSKSRRHADYTDLAPLASHHGIPILRVADINSPEVPQRLESECPDVIFVLGWSQIVSDRVLDIPRLGCIGSHPALLPRNRGRHPIVWALVEGLQETGLTFFFLDQGVDSGDIVWQRSCLIESEDDAASLYGKIEDLAEAGLRDFVPRLLEGTATRTPQDDSLATYWRKRNDDDGRIEWCQTAERIRNLVRGLTRPYVGAHAFHFDNRFSVWRTEVPLGGHNQSAVQPGEILDVSEEGVLVSTSSVPIQLLEISDIVPENLSPGEVLR